MFTLFLVSLVLASFITYLKILSCKLTHAFVMPFIKTYVPLFSLLLFISCGGDSKTSIPLVVRNYENSNPTFEQNVETFYEQKFLWTGSTSRKDIPINLVSDEHIPQGRNNAAYNGICILYYFQTVIITQEILIKETYWNLLNDVGKQYIVDHEFGHCELGRSHTIEYILAQSPTSTELIYASVMYPYINSFIIENYEKYYDGYMQELFTQETTLLVEMFNE